MNKVILIGNLTRDPELSTTSSGISFCRFSLAVSRRFSGEDKQADFINIIVWRAQAENCAKYLKKGSKAAIVGNIQTRTYDSQDGSKRYVTEVVAEEVEFISNSRGSTEGGQEKVDDVSELQPIEDDTLPF